jgi:tRNA A-37 threonylcarbamoyl transferase component Bud32
MSEGPRSTPPGDEAGLVEVRIGRTTCLCRPHVADELRQIYSRGGWVVDELRDQESSLVLYGRQPLVAGTLGSIPVLAKRLFHGGFLAALTRDYFLTPGRLRNHLECADFLASRGVPTPETLFVAWRRRLGLVRGEIGVRYIPRAFDASTHLFRRPEALPADWRQRTAAVASMTATLHTLGVDHGDLNLRNFLFVPTGETHILDLDKALRRRAPLADASRRRNLARLERSVRKQGRFSRPRDVEAVVHALHAAYRSAYA